MIFCMLIYVKIIKGFCRFRFCYYVCDVIRKDGDYVEHLKLIIIMQKLKLNDKQKYELLTFCYDRIMSQGKHPYHFLSPQSSFDLTIKTGLMTHCKASVEIVYSFDLCKVHLYLEYAKVNMFDDVYRYVFIPKSFCIEREFRSSLLISIVRDPETSFCSPIYYYQSNKSIKQLCEDDFEEEGDVHAVPDGACLEVVDVDSANRENVGYLQHFDPS